MRNWSFLVIAIALLQLPASASAQAPAAGRGRGGTGVPATQNINWNNIMFPTVRAVDSRDKDRKAPAKVFDNVYSIGVVTVNAFLITTSAGLVMIDTTFPETVDSVIDNIRTLGFDPANVKYLFISHAAQDHYGGSGRIKQVAPGVRIGMSAGDWQLAEEEMARAASQPNSRQIPFTRDLVITEGQTITVGDTTFKFYVLPGRTPGSLGIEYQARDGNKRYRALSTGALGTPPEPRWDEPFLKSIARLKTLGPFEVWLPNHPWMALPRDLIDLEKASANRGEGPHPALVQPRMLNDYLDFITALISHKMAIEKYQGAL